MTTSPDLAERESSKVRLAPGMGVLAWLFGISGAISLFLGLFIMFGSEDSSIGIGGELSWQVSEVTDGWMYGLLIGGALAVLLALSIALFAPRHEATEDSSISQLIWHFGAFLGVNLSCGYRTSPSEVVSTTPTGSRSPGGSAWRSML